MINYYAYPGYARLTNEELLEVIAKELGTTTNSLRSGSKKASKKLQNYKKIATIVLREKLQLSFNEVGNLQGHKQQNCMNNYYKGKDLLTNDIYFRSKYEHVSNIISKLIRIR